MLNRTVGKAYFIYPYMNTLGFRSRDTELAFPGKCNVPMT